MQTIFETLDFPLYHPDVKNNIMIEGVTENDDALAGFWNFNQGSGTLFRDGEYIPLFKVQPVYPRRAQERGMEGYVIVAFTITESGTIEDPYVIEGKCRNAKNKSAAYTDCSMFNSATLRAAKKLKYKPTVRDGRAVAVYDVPHKYTFEIEDNL